MAGYNDIYGDIYEGDAGADLVLAGNLFISNPVFPVGSLSGPLIGNLFTATTTWPVGGLASAYTLTGNLFTSTATFFAGRVDLGLSGNLFVSLPTFPQGAVSGGELTVQGVLFVSNPIFPLGVVTWEQFLEGNLFVAPVAFHPGFLSEPAEVVARYPLHGTISDNNRRGGISSGNRTGTIRQ